MNNKLITYLSPLLFGCTSHPLQPRLPPSPLEQQAITLNNIEQQLSPLCEKYTIDNKDIHCSLAHEPYYFHYRWNEIKKTYCHGPRLTFDTVMDPITLTLADQKTCVDLSINFNTYLQLTQKK